MANTKKRGAGSLVPLLMRLVLFGAFFPTGWDLLLHESVFTEDDARTLAELGIGRPTQAQNTALAPAGRGILPAATLAFLPVQEAYEETKQEALEEQIQESTNEKTEEAGAELVVAPPPVVAPPRVADEGAEAGVEAPAPVIEIDHPLAAIDPEASVPPVTASRVHRVTTALVRAGWKIEWKPQLAAWATSVLCLAGGLGVMIGLLSRFWAFFLAVIGGAVFAMDSSGLVGHVFELVRDDDSADLYRMFAQLSVFVMAVGVLFVGPGGISADRFIFRGQDGEDEEGIVSIDPA